MLSAVLPKMLIGLCQERLRTRNRSRQAAKDLITAPPAIKLEGEFIQISLQVVATAVVGAFQEGLEVADGAVEPLQVTALRVDIFCGAGDACQALVAGVVVALHPAAGFR